MKKNRKKKVVEALEKSLGVITPACKEVGISRNCFYQWYREDEEFRREVDGVGEIALDFVENQLYKKIKEGSERSIIFYMRSKGKSRGYSDTIDITSQGDKITEITLTEVKGAIVGGNGEGT